jgi:hypothetical protein
MLWHLQEAANGQTTLRAASWRSFPSIAKLLVWLALLSVPVSLALYVGSVSVNAQPFANLVALGFIVLGAASIGLFIAHQRRSARIGVVMFADSMRNTIDIGLVRIPFSRVRAIVLAHIFYYRGSDILEFPEIQLVHDDGGILQRQTVVEAGSNCKKVAKRMADMFRVPLVTEDYRMPRV